MKDPRGTLYWIQRLDRHVARVRETRGSRHDFLLQREIDDLVEHNMLRALESAIALAETIILDAGWEHWDHHMALFRMLARHDVIDPDLSERLATSTRLVTLAHEEFDHLDDDYIERHAEVWTNDLTQFADGVLVAFGLRRPEPECPDDGDQPDREAVS
ncbi:MAG: DUF86 domain-containing protein [Chloroflexi bacterium]|nr:DUF86 domain-containing protein [Chloroflexota bacterium]